LSVPLTAFASVTGLLVSKAGHGVVIGQDAANGWLIMRFNPDGSVKAPVHASPSVASCNYIDSLAEHGMTGDGLLLDLKSGVLVGSQGWSGTLTGVVFVHDLSARLWSARAHFNSDLIAVIPADVPSALRDLNSDGKADILLQHTNGVVFVWTMDGNGGIVVGTSKYIFPNALPGWTVAGIADMNGDGKADILLQNTNGAVFVWTMDGNGGIVVGASKYILSTALPGWRVVGAADMNGDGKADILLQNTNGAVFVWIMDGNGGIVAGASKYIFNNALPDWRVVGAADMNGDGQADILLQNTNGAVFFWVMNGSGALVQGAGKYIYNGALPDWTAH